MFEDFMVTRLSLACPPPRRVSVVLPVAIRLLSIPDFVVAPRYQINSMAPSALASLRKVTMPPE